jgi:hypothetical protein
LNNSNHIFLLIAFVIGIGTVSSQSNPCDIQFRDGRGMTNTRLLGIHKDLVLVTDKNAYKIVNVDKFAKIKFDNGSYIWTGAGIGAAVGFLAGYFLYDILGDKSKKFLGKDPSIGIGLILTIPCGVIGGIIGSLYKNIDIYDLSKMNSYNKNKEIKWIMRYHSKWR